MKRLRFGLQARFLLAMGVAAFLILAILALMLERQAAMQNEVRTLSGNVIHGLFDRSMRSRGETLARQLSESLANPVYYSDLDAIGSQVRSALGYVAVAYVLVYDADGRLIHDGSDDLPGYGQRMRGPVADAAIKAHGLLAQESDEILDVSMPIMIGDQRVGGVRIGMSWTRALVYERKAGKNLDQRLDALGKRHLGWLLLLLAALGLTAVMVAIYVQRTLVAPIRWLAAAARQIEAGDYMVEPRDSGHRDEVSELLRAFGRMSEAIARHDRDVRHMAYTDALTGLTNRLAFREALDHRMLSARTSQRRLALLFADIDDFKRINDTLGHEAGDEALLQFARRIQLAVDQLGGHDALLARFGGDEFVILVEDAPEHVVQVATGLAERLVQELREPLLIQEREVFMGTSIGITVYPGDAEHASALLKNGDIAMYQAKLAGKNCHRFYSRAMDYAVERRVHMEHELRGAWDRDELKLVYQPIFRTLDRRMVGVEVLLRWQHPALGTISPTVFIDVAEQSGLIESIGPKVLRAACHEAMQWQRFDGSRDLFVSVNVSPRQLRSGDLPEIVADCLRESGLPAAQLHLELTETAVIGDELQAASMLARLHRTGVKVWLDDFGTGFSGLSHLRQVPVDGVKIDKSFVADLQRDPDDLALTTAIIAMAHSLGITVVAEGIEQEVQFELLRERGCELGQGFWLSHPLSASEFRQLLANEGVPRR